MLGPLSRLVHEISAIQDLNQALEAIVRRVKQAIGAEVCSVYLRDPDSQELVLMASDGLRPEAIGQVRLGPGQGLVGYVAEREEPLNIRSARNHPRYQYFPQTGEESFDTFMGVPIIHHGHVLGVLIVQQQADARFDAEVEAVLITVAAQLAHVIALAQASGGIDGLGRKRRVGGDRPLPGLSGSPGLAIGTAVVPIPLADLKSIPDRRCKRPDAEEAALLQAIQAVRQDLQSMKQRLKDVLPEEDAALFDAFAMMLDSDTLVERTVEQIRRGNWAPGALRTTLREHIKLFEDMDDPYLRERAGDIRDLGQRILQYLLNRRGRRTRYPKSTVLVGEEISAAMLAEVPPERLAGVVSVRGSRTSHVAILARAMGVPVVMGAAELPVSRVDGAEIIADGYSGRVYINPTRAVRDEYRRLAAEEAELSADLAGLREQPAVTTDGRRIHLYANTGLVSDITPTLQSGAEGIGLYRTEFPFMIRSRFPSEEEQRQIYRQVLEAFHPRPVTLRTLDVGGDKALPYFPIEEDNPFLGWRGIRISLDHPEIFLVQVRAMLRASAGLDNMKILLPMITSVAELDRAMSLIRRAVAELVEEGEAVTMPPVGVMIEVPSAVYQAGVLAGKVDFISVGTNDLTQYLLAVDRNNARVAGLFDALHPAVLRALLMVVDGAGEHRRPVSICGEMAGDPAAAVLLMAMGIDSLSMSVGSLPRVKWAIRSFSGRRARQLLDKALEQENAAEIRVLLDEALERAGLGGLIRAGK